MGNRNKTSSVNGILKTEAVVQACRLLSGNGIETTEDLLVRSEELESKWRNEVRGQASGISWKYLLMLAGQSGVKPDRWIHRFMSRVGAGPEVSPSDFVDAIVKTLDRENIDATAVDHRIWSIERETNFDELDTLQGLVNRFAELRDWDQFHSVKNLLLALVGEIGEVAEIIQWRSDVELQSFLSTPAGHARISEEIADVFIYLMRLAEKAGVDLAASTFAKLLDNERKYPVEESFGNSAKYNER